MYRRFFNSISQARIDAELQEIITEGNRTRESANTIREFLLKILQEDIDGKENFDDEILQEAIELIEESVSRTFYWMVDIAVQMTVLTQSFFGNVSAYVEAELGKQASAEENIRCVVRV